MNRSIKGRIRKGRIRTIAGLLILPIVAGGPAVALSDEAPTTEAETDSPPDDTQKAESPEGEISNAEDSAPEDEAMLQFEQGREFFNQGEYEKAAIALKRAYELRPSYKILYYLGWAESETGNYSRAVAAYNGYLDEAPPTEEAKRIEAVKVEAEKLKARVGAVRVVCDVVGAKVKVNNEVMGVVPLQSPIPVDVGKHEISVVDGPTTLLNEVVRIAGGQEIVLEAASPSQPVPTAAVPPASTQQPTPQTNTIDTPRSRGKKAVGLGGLGLAAALAIGAAVTGALALNQQANIEERCSADGTCWSEAYDGDFDADIGRLRTLAVTTDVLIGTAAVAAVAGSVLLILSRKKPKETAGRDASKVQLEWSGLSLSGRF